MSKSLKAKVESRMRQEAKAAEKAKRKAEQEKIRQENELKKKLAEANKSTVKEYKDLLIKQLDKYLEYLLVNCEDFPGSFFLCIEGGSKLEDECLKNAQVEMGVSQMICSPCSRMLYEYRVFVPEYEKGKMSPLQLRIRHFRAQLSKVKKAKKAEILPECIRVKKLIEDGEYKIKDSVIFVPSTKAVYLNSYEFSVVSNYFKKFHFEFLGSVIDNVTGQVKWKLIID